MTGFCADSINKPHLSQFLVLLCDTHDFDQPDYSPRDMPLDNLLLAPLSSLRVSKHYIPAHGRHLPNSSITNKPLLIYHSAFATTGPVDRDAGQGAGHDVSPLAAGAGAVAVESHLSAVGVVAPSWRYTMYSTTHFHSTSHEVLCVTDGRARLCFGGEGNPRRVEPTVRAGDVMIVPAGVAHRLLEDLSGSLAGDGGQGGFEMVGSYPAGCDWDMCYGRAGEEDKLRGIEKLGWFRRDPIFGDEGPVLDV